MPVTVHDDIRFLRERTSDITEDLKRTLAPQLGAIATSVHAVVPHLYRERESMQDFYPGKIVPYRFTAIPPDFFLGSTPRLFENQTALEEYATQYWRNRNAQTTWRDGKAYWTENMQATIGKEMGRILVQGSSALDLNGWESYEQHTPEVLRGTGLFRYSTFFTAHARPQAEKNSFFDHFPAQNEHAVIGTTPLILHERPSQPSVFWLSVMQNDEGFTRRFFNSCITMGMVIDSSKDAYEGLEGLLVDDRNRELFHRHVQRTNPRGGGATAAFDANRLHHMAVESVQSVGSAFALLAKEIPDGYPHSGDRLIADLATQNMIDKFARLAPFGFIGPVSVFGRHIPDLLYAHKDEEYGYKLRFTPNAIKELQQYSDHMATFFAGKWREYDSLSPDNSGQYPPVQTGTRCPFSGKTRNPFDHHKPQASVITKYANALAAVHNALNQPTPNN